MQAKFICFAIALTLIPFGASCNRGPEDMLSPQSSPSKALQIQWQRRSTAAAGAVGGIACGPGGVLYALSAQTVERSTDNGDTWTTQSTVTDVQCIAAGPSGEVLLGSLNAGVLISRNGGRSWQKTGLTNASVDRIVVSPNGVKYATAWTGTWGAGSHSLWASLDGGTTWNPVALAFPFTIIAGGTLIMASTQGIMESTDNGKTWTQVSSLQGIWRLTSDSRGSIYATQNTSAGIYRSDDNARTWTRIYGTSANNLFIDSAHNILAELWNMTVCSTNRGATWQTVLNYDPSMRLIGPDGARSVFAASPAGLWRTSAGLGSWICIRGGGITSTVTCLLFDRTSGNLIAGTQASGLFVSSDRGATWAWMKGPFGNMFITGAGVTHVGTMLVAVYTGDDNIRGRLFRSTDGGLSWTTTASTPLTIERIADGGHGTVFMSEGNGVYCSADDGRSWYKSPLNGVASPDIALDSAGTVYAGSGGAIYRSTDNGVHWNLVISRAMSIHSIAHTPRGTLVAGCDYSFIRVSDNGSNWAEFQLTSGGSPEFIVVNSIGYLLASWYGVWSSVDDGASWQDASNGLPDAIGRTVCFDSDDYAYVSGGSLVYRSTAPAVVAH